MVKKIRNKVTEKEAVRFTGSNFNEIYKWAKIENKSDLKFFENRRKKSMGIFTLEGQMDVSIGDWVIRGVSNEFYPCKPDIFEKSYEIID